MKTKALDMEKRFLILPGFQNHHFDELLTFYFQKNKNNNKYIKKTLLNPMFKIT